MACWLQSQVAYDYFRDRFSVEANDPVAQDEQVRRNNSIPQSATGYVSDCTPACKSVYL